MADESTPEPAEQESAPEPEESKTKAAVDDAPKAETTPEPKKKPKAASTPRTKDWDYQPPAPALVTRLQRALGRRGRYSGPANGDFNEKTRVGIQKTLATEGFKGKQDGDLEVRNQVQRIQEYAAQHGGFAGEIDRKLTDQAWASFALAVERKQNG